MESFDQLQYLLAEGGVTQLLDTLLYLYSGTIAVIGFFTLVLGALNCFLGYRLFKFWMAFYGFIIGFVLGGIAGAAMDMGGAGVLLALIIGVLGAILNIKLYKLGLFCMVAAISFAALLLITGSTPLAVIVGIIVGIIGVVLVRPVIIITTAISGGISCATGLMLMLGKSSTAMLFVLSLIFLVSGMLVQFKKNPKPAPAGVSPYAAPVPVSASYAATPAAAVAQPELQPAETVTHPKPQPAETVTHPELHPAVTVAQPEAQPAETVAQPEAQPAETVTHPELHPAVTVTHPELHPAVTVTHPELHPDVTVAQQELQPAVTVAQQEPQPAATVTHPELHSAATVTHPELHSAPAVAHPKLRPTASAAQVASEKIKKAISPFLQWVGKRDIVVCGGCGEKNSPQANFCVRCQKTLEPQAFCENCGKACNGKEKFCSSCGEKTGDIRMQEWNAINIGKFAVPRMAFVAAALLLVLLLLGKGCDSSSSRSESRPYAGSPSPAAPAAPAAPNNLSELEDAYALYNAGDLGGALQKFKNIYAGGDHSQDTLLGIENCYFENGEPMSFVNFINNEVRSGTLNFQNQGLTGMIQGFRNYGPDGRTRMYYYVVDGALTLYWPDGEPGSAQGGGQQIQGNSNQNFEDAFGAFSDQFGS